MERLNSAKHGWDLYKVVFTKKIRVNSSAYSNKYSAVNIESQSLFVA